MTTKVGVETLINGISNTESKLILKAGQFPTINDAIQKLLETNTASDNPCANVFFTKRGGYQQNRGSFRGTRGFPNQNIRHFQQGQPDRYFPQYRGNTNRGRGYHRYPQQTQQTQQNPQRIQRYNQPYQQRQLNPNYGMFWTNSNQQPQSANNLDTTEQLFSQQFTNQSQTQHPPQVHTNQIDQQNTANFLGSQFGRHTP